MITTTTPEGESYTVIACAGCPDTIEATKETAELSELEAFRLFAAHAQRHKTRTAVDQVYQDLVATGVTASAPILHDVFERLASVIMAEKLL